MRLEDDLLSEIRWLVAGGYSNRESLFWGLVDIMDIVDIVEPEFHDALRAAIERAFVEHTRAWQAWPAVTDCDRLRAAFASLDKHGVVAAENIGLTQQEGVSELAALAVTKEGATQRHFDGYCFFHEQDLRRVVEGEGLMIAYGTFKDDDEHAAVVARWVLAALENEGFRVSWDGSCDTRMKIPRFRWQRRQPATDESNIEALLNDWAFEVRAEKLNGEDPTETLEARTFQRFLSFIDFGPALLQRVVQEGSRILDRERSREATWLAATVNDRICGAFGELRQRGICAVENAGTTIQDGWGYVAKHVSEHDRGAVFYHRGDVIDAIEGHELWMAFGALGCDAGDDDEMTAAIARDVLMCLRAHGVGCDWTGAVDDRICVDPFLWQRRRWTDAPSYVSAPVPSLTTPKSGGLRALLQRALSPKPTQPSPRPDDDLSEDPRALTTVVKEVRDEGGFHRRRLECMRDAWRERGRSEPIQEGHAGAPLIFTPTNDYHALIPFPTRTNLRRGHLTIFERASQ